MSRFYGVLKGARGEATRCGHRDMSTTAASWHGAIRTYLYIDDQGRDCYAVRETPWHGSGVDRLIAQGVIGKPEEEA
jgi:hypothetical protein